MPFFKVLLRREVVEEVQIFVEADDAAIRDILIANVERAITHADNCECWEGDTVRESVEAIIPVGGEDTRGYVLNLTK